MQKIAHQSVDERRVSGKEAVIGRLCRATRGGAPPGTAWTRRARWKSRTSPGSRTWCPFAAAG